MRDKHWRLFLCTNPIIRITNFNFSFFDLINYLHERANAKLGFSENNQVKKLSTSSAYVRKLSKDTFQKQVDDLTNKLKQICDQDDNERAPQQSAEIFHKLSQIYFQKHTMVSLIRSATLLNA